jgi:uncharacterized protein (TIGR04255 family)
MTAPRELRTAPITEALVDLRAVPTRPLDRAAFGDAVRAKYPRMRVAHTIKAGITFDGAAKPPVATATAADEGLHGFQYFSGDGLAIAQFRVDGFTFNRLRPYIGGDDLLAEALRLWNIYVAVASPAGVSRVALRFINHLPFPPDRVADFLESPPVPAEGAGRVVQGFLNRIQSHDPEEGLTAIRTIASAPASVTGGGVIVDIDASRQADSQVEEAELRPVLERLRVLKNRVFFGSITDRAVEFLNGNDHAIRPD